MVNYCIEHQTKKKVCTVVGPNYSEIPLCNQPENKTAPLLRPIFRRPEIFFFN